MNGQDVIGIAKTGSGKTLSYLLPMFRHIAANQTLNSSAADEKHPSALILVPTRELAIQINDEIHKFDRITKLKTTCIFGGAEVSQQIRQLKKCPDIIVATPGRLIEVLHLNKGRLLHLARISYLVLDEADRMYDAGFSKQLEHIVANVHPKRQALMFSATFPPVVQTCARKLMTFKPIEITFDGTQATIPASITQVLEYHSENSKVDRLLELFRLASTSQLVVADKLYSLQAGGAAIVFVADQSTTELLRVTLSGRFPDAHVVAMSSAMEMEDRLGTLRQFKKLQTTQPLLMRIMVATALASRGIDIPDTKIVINYDCPNHLEVRFSSPFFPLSFVFGLIEGYPPSFPFFLSHTPPPQ